MPKDHYDTLGISRSASPDEIQSAYRKLARKYHPDLNPDDKGAKAKFQEVQSAYEVLNDPQKRQQYDQFGPGFDQMGGGGGGPGGHPFGNVDLNDLFGGGAGGGGGGFADMFRQFTQGGAGGPGAGRGRPRQAAKGRNLTHEVMVAFDSAVMGGEIPVHVSGGGADKTLNIKIPAGIEDGKKIRLRGQGEPGPGGPGDLLVTVRVGNHPCYQRKGHDLHVVVPVTLLEAVTGSTIDVPTPKGTIALKVPPNTSSGKRLRIRGLGIESADGKKGDLFAEIQIRLPADMDDEAVELVRRLDAEYSSSPRADLKW